MPRAPWPRYALTVALVTAGACSHARSGAPPEERAEERADTGFIAEAQSGDVPPIVDHSLPPGLEPGPPRWRPSGVDPRLVVREGGDELGFLEQPCAYDEPCGCLVAAEHRYRRRGDGWSIVVVVPEVEVKRVVKRGTCVEGCGQQRPPDPTPIRSLGAIDPGAVQIDVQRPRKVVRKQTCTDPLVPP
ncbi:hypothetical protein [Nannocystis punicea]|uniref:Secreted protein n=1 Tax=Nannocystis punicea TaxID=2995304 RepID=A0ABY7GXB3_9BACT|nr:hypothetical protein [Nannocystis poenicansa]WAS91578.1 hypothetical protein O0S08_35810 [Nannocystis poenicansa]